MKKITIAIDGYSSCGKSTMAKDLAREIGYIYIDSPDREIIGVDSQTIIRQHGSIHCITMQLPEGALRDSTFHI